MGSEYDIGLRVTFDTDLSYQGHLLQLHEGGSALPMLPPHLVVMEIKVNERIPHWLTELIAVHNLPLTRISKYCRSIEAFQNHPLSQYFGWQMESAQEVLVTSFSLYSGPGSMVPSVKSINDNKEHFNGYF